MVELYVVTRNICKCVRCGDIIESKNRHDFVRCSCGSIFTDGGSSYVRRGAESVDLIEDMTEYRDKTLEELKSDLIRMEEYNSNYRIIECIPKKICKLLKLESVSQKMNK